MSELKVTPIEELIKASSGELVELPEFANGIPFVARLKRPSMLSLAKNGKIPNSLLTKANELFSGGVANVARKGAEDETMMDDLFSVIEVICEASFVEPTYKELKENGIELTDDQLMAVFTYTQNGVKSLENFRS